MTIQQATLPSSSVLPKWFKPWKRVRNPNREEQTLQGEELLYKQCPLSLLPLELKLQVTSWISLDMRRQTLLNLSQVSHSMLHHWQPLLRDNSGLSSDRGWNVRYLACIQKSKLADGKLGSHITTFTLSMIPDKQLLSHIKQINQGTLTAKILDKLQTLFFTTEAWDQAVDMLLQREIQKTKSNFPQISHLSKHMSQQHPFLSSEGLLQDALPQLCQPHRIIFDARSQKHNNVTGVFNSPEMANFINCLYYNLPQIVIHSTGTSGAEAVLTAYNTIRSLEISEERAKMLSNGYSFGYQLPDFKLLMLGPQCLWPSYSANPRHLLHVHGINKDEQEQMDEYLADLRAGTWYWCSNPSGCCDCSLNI